MLATEARRKDLDTQRIGLAPYEAGLQTGRRLPEDRVHPLDDARLTSLLAEANLPAERPSARHCCHPTLDHCPLPEQGIVAERLAFQNPFIGAFPRSS